MKKIAQIRVFIFLCLILVSCEKEDFTLPASVEVSFSAEITSGLNGDANLTGVDIYSKNLRFTGKRNLGDDVDLTLTFDSPMKISLTGSMAETEKVDIPQGLYSRFEVQWTSLPSMGSFDEFNDELEDFLDDINDDDGDDDGNEDDDDKKNRNSGIQDDLEELIEAYFENITPGIIIEGNLSDNGQNFNLIFVVDDEIIMEIPVKGNSGQDEISLDADAENKLSLSFNADFWMKPLSLQIFRQAWIAETDDGEKVIFIQKSINPEIYTILLSRLESAFMASKVE